MATISDRIRQLRTEAGLTQTDFGNIFGIVKSTVSLYEHGRSTPNDEIKSAICQYFHCSMDWLTGLSDDRVAGTSYAVPEIIHRMVELADRNATVSEIVDALPDLNDVQLNRLIGYIQALKGSPDDAGNISILEKNA